jgi:hypothetical protein
MRLRYQSISEDRLSPIAHTNYYPSQRQTYIHNNIYDKVLLMRRKIIRFEKKI